MTPAIVKVLIAATTVAAAFPIFAQQGCADEIRAVNSALVDLIRVQIRLGRANQLGQQMQKLLDERRVVTAEVARLQANTPTETDLATLDDVNPALAERERREAERTVPLLSDARRRLAVLEQKIASVEKEIDGVFRDLEMIEQRMSGAATTVPPPDATPKP